MSELELQDDEREVLLSIYDGDPAFNQHSPITYQYKYGEDGDPKSFLLEISWSKNYPTEKPIINMNAFYNKHLVDSIKERISKCVLDEAEQYIGEAMTYTLFEFVKEKYTELIAELPDQIIVNQSESIIQNQDQEDVTCKKSVKKEQLSKAQKRKQWDRVDAKGDKPRGWDWVDVVKHLSQTGSKDPPVQTSSSS